MKARLLPSCCFGVPVEHAPRLYRQLHGVAGALPDEKIHRSHLSRYGFRLVQGRGSMQVEAARRKAQDAIRPRHPPP